MVPDKIADFCEAAPFRPFELFVSDGRSWLVKHPDFVSFDLAAERLTIYDEETDFADGIDMMAVVSLRYRWEP
jgi:hypothetical protein